MMKRRINLVAVFAFFTLTQAVPALAAGSDVPAGPDGASEDALASVPGLYPVGELVTGLSGSPRGVAIDSKTGFLWVTNRGLNTVTAFDHAGEEQLTFGASGAGSGQLGQPQGLAIDGNEVFVAEELNHRVQVFDRSGSHIRMWGSMGASPGQFNEPCDVEVVGNFVYVSDAANDRIQVFTKSGNFVDQFGTAGTGNGQLSLTCSGSYLTHHDGELFISDSGNDRVAVFSLDGTWERNFGGGTLSFPLGIDADELGQIWVADNNASTVTVWSTVGNLLDDVGGPGSAVGTFSNLIGVVVDPTGSSAWTVEELPDRIQAFTTLTCDGELLTHVGTSYRDTLTTGPGDDVVHLGAGRDEVSTKNGEDTVCGGSGADTIRAGYGNDKVLAGNGDDTVFGGKGADNLFGNDGKDTMDGGNGKDRIRGNAGKDKIDGGSGGDTLLGGAQGDTIRGEEGNDSLFGGSGNDTCKGGPGEDTAKGCETKTGIDIVAGRTEAVIPQRSGLPD